MSKKKALGSDPLSWIKPTVSMDEETIGGRYINHEDYSPTRSTDKDNIEKNQLGPKFERYNIKLTVRFDDKQLDFLTALEREIMKNRSKRNKKERITKNSIVRALVNLARELDIDINEIRDEKEFGMRVNQAILKMAQNEGKKTKAY